jgi:hypothetical protein
MTCTRSHVKSSAPVQMCERGVCSRVEKQLDDRAMSFAGREHQRGEAVDADRVHIIAARKAIRNGVDVSHPGGAVQS